MFLHKAPRKRLSANGGGMVLDTGQVADAPEILRNITDEVLWAALVGCEHPFLWRTTYFDGRSNIQKRSSFG